MGDGALESSALILKEIGKKAFIVTGKVMTKIGNVKN